MVLTQGLALAAGTPPPALPLTAQGTSGGFFGFVPWFPHPLKTVGMGTGKDTGLRPGGEFWVGIRWPPGDPEMGFKR